MRQSLAASLLAALLPFAVLAQPVPANQPDKSIDAAIRAEVIDAALAALHKSYVFPDVAARMDAAIRARLAAGDYGSISSARDFAKALTMHLQEASRDKHLRVTYAAQAGPGGPSGSAPGLEQPSRRAQFQRSVNYGFEKVERLQGNIGYLEMRSFQPTGGEADDIADAAMTMVANADALIIDLRRNGGGSPQMVARVSSYLFEQPTHLNSLFWRDGDRTEEFWTTKEVRGKRFGQSKPVYVLTSARTFSGAEEFSYNLKNLKRATIVGETTGGGAHPGGMQRLHENFSMFVPRGRAISPITKTNWEGVGVIPDVAVPADQALERAIALATEALKK